MRKICFLLFLCATLSQVARGNELLPNVNVTAPRVQGTNRVIYTAMQKSIFEFLMNTKWTDKLYTDQERIRCSFLLNVTEEVSSGEFKATLQIQAERPVYGTTYSTVIFNYMDSDVQFKFNEFDILEFNPIVVTSNLVSVLAYYAYIIIGLDDDSLAMRGGTPAFKQAEKIVIDAQTKFSEGWKPFDGSNYRNRYWMIENILNSKYEPLRVAVYKYSRLGLDRMSESMSEGREQVFQALLNVQETFRSKPDPYLFFLRMFFDNTRADEIVNIFSYASESERMRVYQILTEVDMANEPKYRKLKEDPTSF